MINEHNFLEGKDMLNYQNVSIASNKCMTTSAYRNLASELSFVEHIFGTALVTGYDIYSEYKYVPKQEYNGFEKYRNKFSMFLYENIKYPVNNTFNKISEPLNNGVEYLIGKGEMFYDNIFNFNDNTNNLAIEYTPQYDCENSNNYLEPTINDLVIKI